MNSKALENFLIPEDNKVEIAEEGLGSELLKLVGKGAFSIAKAIAIFIGIDIALVGLIVLPSVFNSERHKKRFANPTSEEKLSRDNFTNSWEPAFKDFAKMINKDINEADKKFKIKKFIDICKIENQNKEDNGTRINGIPQYHTYSFHLCSLNWEACQYPNSDVDDAGNPDLIKEFSEKLTKMKPYFDKWKKEAKKFSPYFELMLEIDDPNEDYEYCNFYVGLKCKWLDKDGILKPGLPEFNNK